MNTNTNQPNSVIFSKVDSFAYAYLLIPLILFIWGWLKIWISIPLILFIILSSYKLFINTKKENILDKSISKYAELAPSLIIFFIYVFLTGITGNWQQHPDFYVRNDIFWTLTTNPWPPELKDGKYFVYYCQSWLPAALIGDIFGWGAARWTFFIWSCTGISLTVYYIFKNTGKCSFWIACAFFIWNGLELFPCLLAQYILPNLNINDYTHFSEPAIFSIKALIHCYIPVSIIGGMLLNKSIVKSLGPALGILAVMYNPMGSIFLLPILLFLFFREYFPTFSKIYIYSYWKPIFKELFSLKNLSILTVFILLILPFYGSTNSISPLRIDQLLNTKNISQYTYYIFFNVVIVVFLIRNNVTDKLLWVVLFTHIICTLSAIALYSDIAKKGSFFTTFFLGILYCQALVKDKTKYKAAFVLYSILGASYFIYMTGAMAATLAGTSVWILLRIKRKYAILASILAISLISTAYICKPQAFSSIRSKLSGEQLKYNSQMGIYQPDGGSGLWWWYKTFPEAKTMPFWFK